MPDTATERAARAAAEEIASLDAQRDHEGAPSISEGRMADIIIRHMGRDAEARKALRKYMEAYPHQAPGDCFATGPLTGDPIKDLVLCPGCEAQREARALLAGGKEGD